MNASAEVACISNWAGPLFIFKPFIYSPYVNMNVHSISRHLYYAVVKKKKNGCYRKVKVIEHKTFSKMFPVKF